MTSSNRPPWRPTLADAIVPDRDMVIVDPARGSEFAEFQQYTAGTLTPIHLTPEAVMALLRRHQRDRERTIAYERWYARQAEIRERDRRARRFWLALGATVGAGILATCGLGAWWLYHAAASLGGLLLLALAVPVVLGLTVGGHRCVTVITHRH